MEIIIDLAKRSNVYEKYGVDRYLNAMGLSVHPSYRGAALGGHILNARYAGCAIKQSCFLISTFPTFLVGVFLHAAQFPLNSINVSIKIFNKKNKYCSSSECFALFLFYIHYMHFSIFAKYLAVYLKVFH